MADKLKPITTGNIIRELGNYLLRHPEALGSMVGKLFRRRGKARKGAVILYLLLARMNNPEDNVDMADVQGQIIKALGELDPKGKAFRDAEELLARMDALRGGNT